jgi:CHC2 zinc finger
MSATELISRLQKVRRTGKGTWTACCPAHQDKSPSLSIRETDDGRVLLHCFSGCDVESILEAVGLTFDDLFPGSHENRKSESRPFPASDVLRLIAKEALIVAATAKTLTNRRLTEKEVDRAIESASLIQGALTASGVSVGAWK